MFVVSSPRNVYSYVRQMLENGEKIEYLTMSSTENLTASITHQWANANKFIKSRQLTVQSAIEFFPTEQLNKVILSNGAERSRVHDSKNSIVVLCPNAVATYLKACRHTAGKQFGTIVSKVDHILEFETAVSKKFHDSLIVCCLLDRFFHRLETVPLVLLLKYHKIAIMPNNMIYISEDDIMDAIHRGIDSVMGDKTSILIFKTIHHVYKIDENFVLQRPELWYPKLERLVGTRNYDHLKRAIASEIRKLVVQKDPHNSEPRTARDPHTDET